jgi:hypothetical protein
VGRLQPPQFCSACGAAFPWAERPAAAAPEPLAELEAFLRRLPRAIRQLRSRHGDRPPFRVQDEHDLEDLLRALLPLYFDDVRLEVRTPLYSSVSRTDFLLRQEAVALAVKYATRELGGQQLMEQLRQDIAYYEGCGADYTLVFFVYDPSQLLRCANQVESMWSGARGPLPVLGVIAS